MALSWCQKEVASSTARFRVVVAGRRWGKTHFAMRELARFASKPDQLCWYIAPSYRMAKQIIWKKLKKKLTSLNWVQKVNETELTLELINGSIIALKGADNYDSLRGVGLNFLVMDEMADIDPEAWFEVLRPTLSDQQGHALLIGTPKGANYFKDLYELGKQRPGWKSWQFTTLDGGNVPAEEVEQARLDLDPRTFRQEYEATFENFSGIIAYAFGEHNYLRTPNDLNLAELHCGVDFNNSPITCAVSVKTKYGLHQFDEIVMHSSNTNELVDELKNRYPKSRIIVYPDPAGRQRKTSANGNTDFTILSNAGFRVLAPHVHDAVKDRINAANSVFHKRDDGTTKFTIDLGCKHTIKSLQQFCYKPDTQVPDKTSGWDHMFDALTYKLAYLFPLQRDRVPVPPERWGHKIGQY